MLKYNTWHQTQIKSISDKNQHIIGLIHSNKKDFRLLQKACKISLEMDEKFWKCSKQKWMLVKTKHCSKARLCSSSSYQNSSLE